VVLFSRRLVESPPSLTMGGIGLPISKEFKYLSIAGTAWGSHPDNMLILYKGLVRSVLEYGCVCFSVMAVTHFKKLERVQGSGSCRGYVKCVALGGLF
jgi:hypothetical protein